MKRLRLGGKHGTGKFALLDDKDHRRARKYKWICTQEGYVRGSIREGNKQVYLHRWLLEAPPTIEVDHQNHNKLDNQRINLRHSTSQMNKANTRKTLKPCSSQYKGVSWCKSCRKWLSNITHNYKFKSLGYFADEYTAALMYDFWATYLFGDYANTNFTVVSTSEKPLGGVNGQMGEPPAIAAS